MAVNDVLYMTVVPWALERYTGRRWGRPHISTLNGSSISTVTSIRVSETRMEKCVTSFRLEYTYFTNTFFVISHTLLLLMFIYFRQAYQSIVVALATIVKYCMSHKVFFLYFVKPKY